MYVSAFLIGIIAGLRSLTAPAAVSWAAHLGWIHLEGTPMAFLGYAFTPWIFTVLVLAELVADQLPGTPSRKAPAGFGARIVMSALAGAGIGAAGGGLLTGAVVAIIGSLAGTFGGYEFRTRLVRATGGRDLPIALLEDAIAIGGALFIVSHAQ